MRFYTFTAKQLDFSYADRHLEESVDQLIEEQISSVSDRFTDRLKKDLQLDKMGRIQQKVDR